MRAKIKIDALASRPPISINRLHSHEPPHPVPPDAGRQPVRRPTAVAFPPNPQRRRSHTIRRRTLGADADGDHRLRHVGPAPLPKRGDSRGRDGPAHESGSGESPRLGSAHHPRPEQLHRILRGHARAPEGNLSAAGRPVAGQDRRLVQPNPRRGTGRLSLGPVRRRRGRLPRRTRRMGGRVEVTRTQSPPAVDPADRPSPY